LALCGIPVESGISIGLAVFAELTNVQEKEIDNTLNEETSRQYEQACVGVY